MKYTLLWAPVLEERLAAIWAEGPDRQAIADAANAIDRALRFRPLSVGESREGAIRTLFEEPLVVVYEVIDDDRLVRVLDVRRVPKRR